LLIGFAHEWRAAQSRIPGALKAGRSIFAIEADSAAVSEALARAGFIDPFEEDHEAIRQALQRAVEIWLIEETK
jgi:hypothetical protein